ncbi:MAG: GNAT family N-acetyltransferase [Burkholderiaceae bacterium]
MDEVEVHSAGVTTRRARADDADAIADVHVESWRSSYAHLLSQAYLDSLSKAQRAKSWRAALEQGAPEIWLGPDRGTVTGWIAFDRDREPGAGSSDGEIWALYVAAGSWGSGLGTALCERACARLAARGFKKVTLWVFEDNPRARGFYQKRGFVLVADSARSFELGGVGLREVCYAKALPTRSAPLAAVP